EEERLLNDFAQWRTQLRSIENLGAAMTFQRNLATADKRIEPVMGAEITANAFKLIGTPAALGRALVERDEQSSEPMVAVISQSLWKSRFDGDPTINGQQITLGTAAATIVGVMPSGFGFPMNHRIWVPLRLSSAIAPRS